MKPRDIAALFLMLFAGTTSLAAGYSFPFTGVGAPTTGYHFMLSEPYVHSVEIFASGEILEATCVPDFTGFLEIEITLADNQPDEGDEYWWFILPFLDVRAELFYRDGLTLARRRVLLATSERATIREHMEWGGKQLACTLTVQERSRLVNCEWTAPSAGNGEKILFGASITEYRTQDADFVWQVRANIEEALIAPTQAKSFGTLKALYAEP